MYLEELTDNKINGGEILMNDLVIIKEKLINICDMSEYFSLSSIKSKVVELEYEDSERIYFEIEKKDIINRLNRKGINKKSIEYNLSAFISNFVLYDNDFLDKRDLEKRKQMYKKHSKIKTWLDKIFYLIDKKAKPANMFYVDRYIDLFLIEDSYEDEFEKFLLKENLEILLDIENDDTLYNVPFLSRDEYLFAVLEGYPDNEKIIIDVTERHSTKIQKIKQQWNIRKKTVYLKRIEEKYQELKLMLDSSEGNSLQIELLTVYAVTMFESYLKDIILLCINNSSYYLGVILKKYDKFSRKEKELYYTELFDAVNTVKEKLTEYVKEQSFQSASIVELFLVKIFEIYSYDSYKSFQREYEKLLNKRHIVVHRGGYNDDGTKIKMHASQLKKWYKLLFETIEKIDRKIFISLIN